MDRVIKFLRRSKIRNRITVFLLTVLLLFSIIILLFSTNFSQAVVKGYLYDYVEAVQKEIVSSIELVIDEVTMLTVRLQVNQDIYDLFDEKELTYDDKSKKLRDILDRLLVHKETIGNIVIVPYSGESYSYSKDNPVLWTADNSFISHIEKSAIPVWGDVLKDENDKSYIPYGLKYRNFYTGQKLGYLIVYIREDALINIYKGIIPEWGYSFIVTDNGYVVSHPQKEVVGKTLFEFNNSDNEDIFTYKTIDYGDQKNILATYKFSERLRRLGCTWNIASAISYNQLFDIIKKVNRYLIIVGILMMVISIIASVSISNRLNRPMKKLGEKLNEFGKGKLDVIIAENERDEIWELEKNFNDMVKRINELIINNNREKEKQRELELIALQAQINPHFLYNTLDAIGWIAKLRKQEDIEQMVIALAKFFRLSLHRGDKFITIEEEIQLVQSFVTIEQMRAPDKFDISYNVPEAIKDIKILKIVLQPLVENAIKHGISGKRGKGNISVNAFEIENGLKFEVIDDGIGFDASSIDFKKKNDNIRCSGYGLRNVDERIKLEYGQEYGLKIMSEINKGTTAEITLKILDYNN